MTIAHRMQVPALTASLVLVGLALPARADEVPADQRLQVEYVSLPVGGGVAPLAVFLALGPSAPPSTTVQATVSSCGRVVAEGTGSVAGTGKALVTVDLANYDGPNRYLPTVTYPSLDRNDISIKTRDVPADFIAESFTYDLVVSTPGADPYPVTGTNPVDGFSEPPTCAEVDQRFATAPTVTRWTDTVGKPKVGKRLKVTPTVAPGARITYRWQAYLKNKLRTVGKKPSLAFERPYKRYLALTVTVSQPGKRKVQEIIEYV